MQIQRQTTYSFPADHGGRCDIIAVLVGPDANGLFAVYAGQADDPEWVARHGVKHSYRQALYFFPGLKEEEYRR